MQKSKFQSLYIKKNIYKSKQQQTSQNKYFCKIWLFLQNSNKICNFINFFTPGEFFRDFFFIDIMSVHFQESSFQSFMHALIPGEASFFSCFSYSSQTSHCRIECRVCFWRIFSKKNKKTIRVQSAGKYGTSWLINELKYHRHRTLYSEHFRRKFSQQPLVTHSLNHSCICDKFLILAECLSQYQ